jgi:GH25 family lysozyme M1 (1,4-beta-N-acetylmuramidase)
LSAAINGTSLDKELGSCSYSATCTAGGITGVCVSISAGCCSGTQTANLCPGSSDIKCCTNNKCSTPWGSGTCKQTTSCSGTSYSGYCTGPSSVQCCVPNSPGPAPAPAPSPSPSGEFGVDVSTAMSTSTASCMKSGGLGNFVIPRGYRSSGSPDPNACSTLNAAKSAGIAKRDVYLFPCPTCSSSAAQQIQASVNALNSGCSAAWSGRTWLDIEGSQYWTGSTSSNQAWYKQLVDACNTYSKSCGVYSSASQWSAIFGSSSFSYGSNLPLWYAHYDNKPSFSDFSSFGGWKSPHVKQYAGDVTSCSMGVDKNYSPNF